MEETMLYNKEYRLYMEYALEQFLVEKQGMTQEDARLRVMQDYEEVEKEAKEAKFL